MEVLGNTHHHGLILRNALDLVAPFPSNLDSRLDCLSTRVHR